jgi:translation initiation factor 5A
MEKRETEIKKLKKGGYVIMDDEACVVDSIQLSKPGKHGGAKARITATGIFTGSKKNIVKPASTKIGTPVIKKKSAQVLAITGDTAQLMDMEDYSTIDAKIPNELRDKIKEGENVLIWKFGSNILIKDTKGSG